MEQTAMRQTEACAALNRACELLRENLAELGGCFWASNSEQGFYPVSENVEWTTGFCTGQYWLAYEHTGDAVFRAAALKQADSFLERIETHRDVDHHDMGFLYTPSCVAAWRLAGSESAKQAALLAARQLMTRFQQKGGFFQAWGPAGAKDNYRLIIDCLLNLPLLYWASETTGDGSFRAAALAHTRTSLANLVRPDDSTYHTYFFDPATGAPVRGATQQGYKDGSAWARGQAWGVYGTALAYHYTRDTACVELFYRVTNYFAAHLPEDMVPFWDLSFMEGDEPRDSSAAAIAACGMLEMAPQLPPEQAARCTLLARRIAASLAKNYAVQSSRQSNGLLLHGVYAKSSPYNPIPRDRGVDECNTWGDYFYMELLTRLCTNWKPYWE